MHFALRRLAHVAAELPRNDLLERLFVKNFALPVLFFVVLYVVLILPQGRKRRQAAALQRAVEPGSRVLLTSGLYAIVVEIEEDTIILEAAVGVHLRYAKAAVLRVVPHLDETDEDYDDEIDEDDDAAGHDDAAEHADDDHEHGDHDHEHGDHDHEHGDDHDHNDEHSDGQSQGNDAGSGPVSQA